MKKQELSDLFSELKKEYLDSFEEKFQSLMRYWQTGDRKNLQNEFHKIKGTGTTYGVQEATDVASIMEDLCAQESPQLGFNVLLSLELLQKIRAVHRQGKTFDLKNEKSYEYLYQSRASLKKSA